MINTENTAPAMIAKQTVYARKNQTFLLTFSSLFLRNLVFLRKEKQKNKCRHRHKRR